jgi:hypothetical protein
MLDDCIYESQEAKLLVLGRCKSLVTTWFPLVEIPLRNRAKRSRPLPSRERKPMMVSCVSKTVTLRHNPSFSEVGCGL